MFPDDIISFIISPPTSPGLLALKILIGIFSALLLLFIVFLLTRTSWLKFRILLDIFEFFTFRSFGIKKLAKQWAKISARLESGLESEYKLAVIESDSLIDDILKKIGYPGESLGQRLDKIPLAVLPDIEEVRVAHQIRNNIVHDPDYQLSLDEAKNTLAIYGKALANLGAL